ncbi:MAG: FtsX-like permease family protein [Acidobacteria bacterium]|nr:FtsX-like permease family protein [Acidobacteriota bacterium]MBW4044454.1 FtsX-like permease family protein [Acidobacteriota bacterium]
MGFYEAFRIALQSLWANKLRSVLTLIGVVIGVSSVIAVITMVNGANRYVATKISGYGSDTLNVVKMPNVIFSAEEYLRYLKRKDINIEDYKAIAADCTRCRMTGAALSSQGKVVSGKQSADKVNIAGWTWTMPEIMNLNIAQGRAFTAMDDDRATHVVIVGYDIVDNLFPHENPVGKEVRVDGEVYTIVGVGERQGTTLGQSQDNYVNMPLSTYMNSHGAHQSIDIFAKAGTAPGALDATSDQVRAIMRGRRHDAPGSPDSFTIETNSTFVDLWKQLTQTFAAVVVGIASISLVVGGVVIMNIMLVSVTERTREIGIRKALGARRHDLMMQFLIESATMALVGGVIGVLAGAGVAEAITLAIGWPSAIKLWSVLLGLFVSGGVGIFFGVYPARKAAMLDPIVALRAEM